jgi:hypothetical protein
MPIRNKILYLDMAKEKKKNNKIKRESYDEMFFFFLLFLSKIKNPPSLFFAKNFHPFLASRMVLCIYLVWVC